MYILYDVEVYCFMKDFTKALNNNSIIEMQCIPKSDLHSQ